MNRLWRLYELSCFWLFLVVLIDAAIVLGVIGHG